MTIVEAARGITGGVDTHLDVHVAAALDPLGGLLGTERFETSSAGYKSLLTWLETFGAVTKIGVEGAGSYGTGLSRYLRRVGIEVIEVDRPNRKERRRRGKSDPLDAVRPPGGGNWINVEATTTPDIASVVSQALRTLRELFAMGDYDKVLIKMFSSSIRGDTPASPEYSTEDDAAPLPIGDLERADSDVDGSDDQAMNGYICRFPVGATDSSSCT
jgi:hypothetical protein